MLAVRAGEGRTVALLAGLFASIEAARGAGEVAYVTLFLSRLGPTYLPYLYIALGGVSLVVALGYGVGLGKLPRRPFLVGLLLAFAGTLVVLRLTLASGAPIAFGVIGVAINVVNTIMLTLVWTIAATALDARQAKRLFPLVTSAAIAGGFVGTLAAGPLTALIGPENLVLLVAGLIVLGAAFAARIGTRATRTGGRRLDGRPRRRSSPSSGPASTTSAAPRSCGSSPIAYVLFSILMFSVQFPYQTAIADAFGDDDAALATFVGLVQAGVTAISFVVSIAFANRIFARFGVVAAALSCRSSTSSGSGRGSSSSRSRPPSRCRSASRSSSGASRTRPGVPCTRSSRASGGRRCWRSWTACPDSWERACQASCCWPPARSPPRA